MDKQSNSTPVPEISIGEAAAAVVDHAETAMSARQLVQTRMDAVELSTLTMRELRNLYDALRLAETSIDGIINQPRFEIGRTHHLNAAGEVIDGLHTFLLNGIELVIHVAKSAAPTTAEELEERAWLLLKYEAACGECLADFVALAAQQNAAVDGAAFLARAGRASV